MAVHETLLALSEKGPLYVLSYEFNQPAMGASRYQAVWQVQPVGQALSLVTMTASWECADEAASAGIRIAVVDLFNNMITSVTPQKQE